MVVPDLITRRRLSPDQLSHATGQFQMMRVETALSWLPAQITLAGDEA